MSKISQVPIYVHYDDQNVKGVGCTDKRTVDILREQSRTLQRAYTYTMKSDRVDRFQSDWQFREQLIDSLKAAPFILETKEGDVGTGESGGS